MIAGLDSSFFRPSPGIAQTAKAAGVGLWCGYLASRARVGLAAPWDRGSFEAARLCGATPIAFCSGWDDPAALKQLAAAWNVRLCVDVEGGGLRDNGDWVQGFLDAAAPCGLYGNSPVFAGRRAAFYVLAAYPGSNPGASWSARIPRPNGPCGWQWWGSHDEFGGGVDRGWYDDWFGAQVAPEEEDMPAAFLLQGDQRGAVWLVMGNTKFYISNLVQLAGWMKRLKVTWPEKVAQYEVDHFPRVLDLPENLGGTGLNGYDDVVFGVPRQPAQQLAKAVEDQKLWYPSDAEIQQAGELAAGPHEKLLQLGAELQR